jgi:hypothetical protein
VAFKGKKKCIDNWRYDLHGLDPSNDPLLIRSCDINKASNPVLFDICLSYEIFYSTFCEYEKNYLHALFRNALFKDTTTGRQLNKEFFGIDFYNNNKNAICNLRYIDCFSNLGFKTLQECQEIGLQLSLAVWMRLRNTVNSFIRPAIGAVNRIDNFVSRWKKGCKRIRNLMQHIVEVKILLSNIRTVNTFINLAETHLVDKTFLIIFEVYRYLIFKTRLRKIIPTQLLFLEKYCHYIRWLCRTNKRIKALIINSFPGTILLQAIG